MLKTQLVDKGITTVDVSYDPVTKGFKFLEAGGGAITLQVPQTVKNLTFGGTVGQDDQLTFELKSGDTTVILDSGKLAANASLDDCGATR